MPDIAQLTFRFVAALALGAILGAERNLAGKEAGIRTSMLVASGASLFTMTGLTLPYLLATSAQNLNDIIAHSPIFNLIANIAIGIGFLGAGIVIKNQEHVRGLTTAAVVWITAAIGILCGIGLIVFAVIVTILTAGLLYLLRNLEVHRIGKES